MAYTQPNPVEDYLRARAEAQTRADLRLFNDYSAYLQSGLALPWPMVQRMLTVKAEAS